MHLLKPLFEGVYKPTFFNLLINKNDALDGNNKINEIYGHIFFHEYIHYLQDVLTSFGLRNIARLAREFSIINHEIIDSLSPNFTIPFKSQNTSLLNEGELFRIFWGTDELEDLERDFVISGIELQPNIINPTLAGFPFVNVNIIYRDNLDHESFYLGVIHFLEGMAHILERNFELGIDADPFPYKVIERLTRAIFPSGEFTDRNFILIIEAALETHNPARYYFDYHVYCQHGNLPFNEDSITLFKKTYRTEWDKKTYRYSNFYYPNAVLARHSFDVMFNHEQMASLNKWGRLLLANTVKIRRSGFSFAELLVTNGDKQRVEKLINRIVNKLGTPVMTDGKFGVFMLSPERQIPEEEMTILLGLEAVSNILHGDTTCSILPFCKYGQHGTDITDANCNTTPWKRAKVSPQCLLARLWIMWGFVKKGVIT